MKTTDTLRFLLRVNSQWQRGDHLSSLEISPTLWRDIVSIVRAPLVEGFHSLKCDEEKTAWGALMLLAGSRAFQSLEEGPYTYERIGEELGLSDLNQKVGQTVYRWMARGLKRHWDIPLLHRNDKRQFRATMLLNSGGSEGVLEPLCQEVGRRGNWSWELIGIATIEDLLNWFDELAQERNLSKAITTMLSSDEAKQVTAERLKIIARSRQILFPYLQEGGHLQEVTARLSRDGISLVELLPFAPRVREQVLQTLIGGDSQSQEDDKFRWFVRLQPGAAQLRIQLPTRIIPRDLPPGIERVLVNVAGHPLPRPPSYRRAEESFVLQQEAVSMPVPAEAPFPLRLVVEYKEGLSIAERPFQELSWPDQDVQLFSVDTGKELRSAPAGANVVLLLGPGRTLQAPHTGLTPLHSNVLEAFLARVPETPETLTIVVDGEEREYLFGPSKCRLDASILSSPRRELRLRGAPVFQDFPHFWIPFNRGEVIWNLTHPDGSKTSGTRSFRNGRITLPIEDSACGYYKLHLSYLEREARLYFGVLPEETTFSQDFNTNGGATVKIDSPYPLQLRHEKENLFGEKELTLPANLRGPQPLWVKFDAPHLDALRWIPEIWSQSAHIRTSRNGGIYEGEDISVLRSAGGIQVFGAPGKWFELEVNNFRLQRCFDSRGEYFLPFSNLPPELLEVGDGRLYLKLRWSGGDSKELGPFVDPTQQKIKLTYEPREGRLRLRLMTGLSDSVEDLSQIKCALIPAWKPWQPASFVDTHIGSDHQTFEAYIQNSPPGPYLATLSYQGHRISGFTSFLVSGSKDFHNQFGRSEEERLSSILLNQPADQDRQERFEALKELLASPRGLHFETALLDNLVQWGPQWFALSEPFALLLTDFRLRAIGAPDDMEKTRKVLRFYEQLQWPRWAIRNEGFTSCAAEIGNASPERIRETFENLAESEAGLLIPAYFFWREELESHLSEIAPYLCPWLSISGDLKRLTHHQTELLRSTENSAWREERDLRMLGLRQALENQHILNSDRFYDLNYWVQNQYQMGKCPEFTDLLHQTQITSQLQRIEMTAVLIAIEIDAWRCGERSSLPFSLQDRLFQQSRDFMSAVPRLLDFWLNVLALRRNMSSSSCQTESSYA